MAGRRALWWTHAWLPIAIFLPLALFLGFTRFDYTLAHALFYDAGAARFIGRENFWTNEVLHTGGRWAVRLVVAAVLAFWIAALARPGLRPYRRPAGYFVAATVLSVGFVGLLKTLTGVPCPWSLTEFGGTLASAELFEPRPPGWTSNQCFPSAHASSGYALLALYFVFREHHKILARLGLTVGILVGLVFGIAQQSRGAHFLSHDLWSAFLVWMVVLTLYTFGFKGQLWQYTAADHRHHDGAGTEPALAAVRADAGAPGLGGLPGAPGGRSAR